MENRRENTEALFAKILDLSKLVEPIKKLDVVKADPDDNKILEAALAGKADYVVSYDPHLTELREWAEIKIITPTNFLLMWRGLPQNERLRETR